MILRFEKEEIKFGIEFDFNLNIKKTNKEKKKKNIYKKSNDHLTLLNYVNIPYDFDFLNIHHLFQFTYYFIYFYF